MYGQDYLPSIHNFLALLSFILANTRSSSDFTYICSSGSLLSSCQRHINKPPSLPPSKSAWPVLAPGQWCWLWREVRSRLLAGWCMQYVQHVVNGAHLNALHWFFVLGLTRQKVWPFIYTNFWPCSHWHLLILWFVASGLLVTPLNSTHSFISSLKSLVVLA